MYLKEGSSSSIRSNLCVFDLLAHACLNHRKNQDACHEAGAIDAIIAYVKDVTDVTLLSSAYSALQSITEGHDKNAEHMAKIMPRSLAKKLRNATFAPRDEEQILSSLLQKMSPVARKHWDKYDENLAIHPVPIIEHKRDVLKGVFEERAKEKLNERCSGCGKSAEMCGLKQLMRCSACTLLPGYCGAECQRACWAAHKKECKANRKSK
jgi:hypothetical protein